jgi:hypothetical protein
VVLIELSRALADKLADGFPLLPPRVLTTRRCGCCGDGCVCAAASCWGVGGAAAAVGVISDVTTVVVSCCGVCGCAGALAGATTVLASADVSRHGVTGGTAGLRRTANKRAPPPPAAPRVDRTRTGEYDVVM